jgi:hypothetical protein
MAAFEDATGMTTFWDETRIDQHFSETSAVIGRRKELPQ